jgi:hypothetical protein
LIQAYGLINGRHDASMFTVSARCESDCNDEREMLHEFIATNQRAVLTSIDNAYFKTVGEG